MSDTDLLSLQQHTSLMSVLGLLLHWGWFSCCCSLAWWCTRLCSWLCTSHRDALAHGSLCHSYTSPFQEMRGQILTVDMRANKELSIPANLLPVATISVSCTGDPWLHCLFLLMQNREQKTAKNQEQVLQERSLLSSLVDSCEDKVRKNHVVCGPWRKEGI